MLDRLSPRHGSRKPRKRVGRGPGSGTGKTAGRGVKGQGKRSPGRETPFHFEGGQMPLVRRIPKRGFNNFTRVEHIPVNLSDLEKFDDGTEVTLPLLKEAGLANGTLSSVKILGNGKLTKKLTVRANAFSKSAQAAIQARGGTCEVIS